MQVRASSPDVRLVVVLVIDQFRYEYLHRFREHFVEGGFNRLLQQGANFTNAEYRHGTSDTCAGHAVIATGTWANVNGVIGNGWFDTESRSGIGCVSPGASNPAGKLLRPTIGDLLKNASGGRSKSIAISGKSAAAILLGGRLADSVYWPGDRGRFRDSAGNDSTLPEWVSSFNDSGRVEAYYGRPWEKLLPADAYAQPEPAEGFAAQSSYSDVRETIHELTGGVLAVDPGFYKAFEASPYQDEVLADFVMTAVREERLGQNDHADLIAVSFSSSDRVGHAYGPYSHEIQDTVVRLDRQLARLFAFIDQEVGLNRTLLVLTADHGAAPVPESAEDRMGVEIADRMVEDRIPDAAGDALHAAYGEPESGDWVVFHDFPNLHLNEEAFRSKGVQLSDAERTAKRAIEKVEGIKAAYTHSELEELSRSENVPESIRPILLSFYPRRSGHIVYQVMPFRVVSDKGTNHGSHWIYDTHVPMLWLGPMVNPGNYAGTASPADIAPTLMTMLGIEQFPRFSGRVLHEILTGPTAQSPE